MGAPGTVVWGSSLPASGPVRTRNPRRMHASGLDQPGRVVRGAAGAAPGWAVAAVPWCSRRRGSDAVLAQPGEVGAVLLGPARRLAHHRGAGLADDRGELVLGQLAGTEVGVPVRAGVEGVAAVVGV